jgi:hypothetical protein
MQAANHRKHAQWGQNRQTSPAIPKGRCFRIVSILQCGLGRNPTIRAIGCLCRGGARFRSQAGTGQISSQGSALRSSVSIAQSAQTEVLPSQREPDEMFVVRGPLRKKVPGGVGEGTYKDEEERFNWQSQLPETRNHLRFLPLGFLPLGADRTVLCGARTNPKIGTLAT